MQVGQVITFIYDNCEYLGKILSLRKEAVSVWVLGADVDFLMRYGKIVELTKNLTLKG